MLIYENLSCARSERILFSGLSITLFPGSLLQLMGGNGAGKTSLLRIMAGLLAPTAGQMSESKNHTQHSTLNTLFLGHQNAIKSELTVAENLQFWTRLNGEELLLPAALKFWGLDAFAGMRVGQLSAGWQRRVALARLICCPADVWLLDEPTQNLDDKGKKLLAGMISAQCNGGGIVVMATHEADLVSPAMTIRLEDFQ